MDPAKHLALLEAVRRIDGNLAAIVWMMAGILATVLTILVCQKD